MDYLKLSNSDNYPATHITETRGANNYDLQGDFVRHVLSPRSLLSQGNLDAMRRFVLSAPDPFEQRARQRALLEQSTTDLALWPFDSSRRNSVGNEEGSVRVVQASLLAMPFVVTTQARTQIPAHLDWSDPRSAGAMSLLTRSFAEKLQFPVDQVRLLGAVNVRHLLSATPLQLRSVFIDACKLVSDRNTVGSSSKTEVRPSPLRWVIPKELPVRFICSLIQPQAYILVALAGQEMHAVHKVSGLHEGSTYGIGELLAALIASGHRGSTERHTIATPLRESQVTVGSIERIHDAITKAQGLEVITYEQLARKSAQLVSIEFRREGLFCQVQITLGDCDGDLDTHRLYSYDPQWRDPEHFAQIIADFNPVQRTDQNPSLLHH